MNVLTWINTIVLGILVIGGWWKLAHGDESDGCCAVILLCLFLGCAALGGIVWAVGEVVGWW